MSLRVVVVDNDPAALDLVVTDLGFEGHVIVGQGRSGDDALLLVGREHPDVLVVDHRMPPGRFGVDVAEEMARTFPDVRVIVYSNYRSAELANRVRAAGATLLAKGNLRALRRAVRHGG